MTHQKLISFHGFPNVVWKKKWTCMQSEIHKKIKVLCKKLLNESTLTIDLCLKILSSSTLNTFLIGETTHDHVPAVYRPSWRQCPPVRTGWGRPRAGRSQTEPERISARGYGRVKEESDTWTMYSHSKYMYLSVLIVLIDFANLLFKAVNLNTRNFRTTELLVVWNFLTFRLITCSVLIISI